MEVAEAAAAVVKKTKVESATAVKQLVLVAAIALKSKSVLS